MGVILHTNVRTGLQSLTQPIVDIEQYCMYFHLCMNYPFSIGAKVIQLPWADVAEKQNSKGILPKPADIIACIPTLVFDHFWNETELSIEHLYPQSFLYSPKLYSFNHFWASTCSTFERFFCNTVFTHLKDH